MFLFNVVGTSVSLVGYPGYQSIYNHDDMTSLIQHIISSDALSNNHNGLCSLCMNVASFLCGTNADIKAKFLHDVEQYENDTPNNK